MVPAPADPLPPDVASADPVVEPLEPERSGAPVRCTAPTSHAAVRATPRWSVASQPWPALRTALFLAGIIVAVGPPLAASLPSFGFLAMTWGAQSLDVSLPPEPHCTTFDPLPVLLQACARCHWFPEVLPLRTVLFSVKLLPKIAPPCSSAVLFANVTLVSRWPSPKIAPP